MIDWSIDWLIVHYLVEAYFDLLCWWILLSDGYTHPIHYIQGIQIIPKEKTEGGGGQVGVRDVDFLLHLKNVSQNSNWN